MAIIEVQNLTKRYDSLKAVNNVSFKVKNGETFGILGPNGAGKTTTLEMIEGLRSITKGKILVNAINVAKKTDEVKKIIGVQLQSSSYFEKLKLTELLSLFASFYKIKIDPMFTLKKVGLEKKANSYIDKLSGGQQQRFSIASTLVNKPKIVFLDEPTTGLDPQARRNIWDLIQQIRTKGETIVLTTHYMEEAEYLCDRIAIMNQGKIIAMDTPAGLIKRFGSGSIISFKSSKKLTKETLKELPLVKKVFIKNQKYQIITKNVLKTLKQLIQLENKYCIINLFIKPSTLEDVFLNLTGRSLKE